MVDVPVKGAVLQWAREFRGLSEDDAADRLGLSIDELRAYEAGDRLPSLTMFEKFAARYRLPQATLFRRTPPKIKPLPDDFRTLEGRRPSFSFDFLVSLSNVRTLASMFERVAEDDEEFAPPHLPLVRLSEDPAEAGERERKRLGISPAAQLDWDKDETFRRWRSRIEREGVLVFQQKYALEDCRGFSLYETKNSPIIVVNKQDRFDVAKIFTLIHEYAHLLIRQPGVSDQNNRHPIETFCNRFAAAFLMPRDALRQVMPTWPNQPVEWDDKDVSRWARRLKVSRMALALRLEHLGLAPEHFAARYRQTALPESKKSSGGNYVATRLSELGSNYTGAVLDAMDRGAIDEVQAVEALGLSSEHFEEARHMIERHSTLASG